MRSSTRLHPAIWDHQYHPLVGLRRALNQTIPETLTPPETGGGTVIDLGCGGVPYRPLFTERGYRYIGCDIEGAPDVLIGEDGRVPLADGSAEGVVSFQVLEHVWDLGRYLGECRRLCRPGGWLILSTHGTWPYHPHPTDFRRWTRDGLTRELTERGFEVAQVRAILGPLAWTTQIRLLGCREVLLRVPLARFLIPVCCALMNLRIGIEEMLTPASFRESNACIYVTFSRRRE